MKLLQGIGVAMIIVGLITILGGAVILNIMQPDGKIPGREQTLPGADSRQQMQGLPIIGFDPLEIAITVPDHDGKQAINAIVNNIRGNGGYVSHISYKAFHDCCVPTIQAVIPFEYLFDARDYINSQDAYNEYSVLPIKYSYHSTDKMEQNTYIKLDVHVKHPIFERSWVPVFFLSLVLMLIVGLVIICNTHSNTVDQIQDSDATAKYGIET